MPSAASSPTSSMPSGSIHATGSRRCSPASASPMSASTPCSPPIRPRNQDLGMMAHRMFLTCRGAAQGGAGRRSEFASPTSPCSSAIRACPTRSSASGQFNPEDFETVQRLKSALAEIPGYRFAYLDNHASLLSDLRGSRAALRPQPLRRGLQQRRLHGAARPGAAGDARHPLQRRRARSASGCATTRPWSRAIAAALDMPVPLETYFNSDDQAATIPSVFPALVKPNYGDSQIGITSEAVVHTSEQALDYLGQLREQTAGPADPDPGVPDRPRIQRRHHRQSRGRASTCCRRSRSIIPACDGEPAAAPLLRIEVDPGFALLDPDRLPRGAARRGHPAQAGRLLQHPVRAAGLPRLRPLRFPHRRRGRDQAPGGQSQPGLVLGRQAQHDGDLRGAALLRAAEAHPRGGAGARGSAAAATRARGAHTAGRQPAIGDNFGKNFA